MTDETGRKILVRILQARHEANVADPRRWAMIYAVALDDVAGMIEGPHQWTLVRTEDICRNPDGLPVHAPATAIRDCQACADDYAARHRDE